MTRRELLGLGSPGIWERFWRAMQAFALRAGSPVNHADIARELGLVARTLRRWLDLLDMTNQIVEVPTYAVRRSVRVRKRAKYYWNDSALAMHVAGASQAEGVHLETFVLNDIRVWAASDPSRPTVHYWRDEAQREVDFVIERHDRLLAVEVKATARPHSDDWKHLNFFLREHGDRCVGGLLLHGGQQTFRASDGVLAIPWWRIV